MSEEVDSKIVHGQDSTSILGIVWNFKDDEFQFKVQKRAQPDIITKRVITSEAARIFDPQGYVTPVTIRAKLFIQELWRTKSDWDEPLSPELQAEWKAFYEELRAIDQVKIPNPIQSASVPNPSVLRRLQQGIRSGSVYLSIAKRQMEREVVVLEEQGVTHQNCRNPTIGTLCS